MLKTKSDAEEMFSQPLLKEAKMKSQKWKYYVSLPPGDILSKHGMIAMTDVPVAFKQFEREICAWAGAASAMFHVGLHKQACAFFSICWFTDKGINWNPFLKEMRKCLPNYDITVRNKALSINNKLLDDTNSFEMAVTLLEDNVGGVTHSVTIANELIFDSNEQFALPFNRQSLD